jgi:hypothetical protein
MERRYRKGSVSVMKEIGGIQNSEELWEPESVEEHCKTG